jgi:predicted DNA-binding transcriptional regulator YafY
MSRAERLMDLAELLKSREGTSVAALAAELGVSRRTALRDLAALRRRGLPITGEAGPGGGVRFEGDRGVTAVHLSLAEVASMWLAARLAREATDLPWGNAARSGLTKLLASLPRARAQALRALCRRVVVGPGASANVRQGAGRPPQELLGLFEGAFSSGLGLGFQYVDRAGRASLRRVEPHGLLVEPPVWYVLEMDLDKREPRTFRMDRIVRPRLLTEVRFRPNLDLVLTQLPDRERWRPLLG